ncbi:acetyltransferase [Bacillus sp. FJAT-22090]|uniref:acetyltransferase n=1 Tax=Bacillus sp. FJAT-22090 TaxID=1581038 RepID=UPI00119FB076|nr:acetyltransferase [Bacillus sp. FJAT-22090]
MEKIILIGDSGHSKVIADSIRSQNGKIIAKLDDKYQKNTYEHQILKGPIHQLEEILVDDVKVVIAIGSNSVRKQLVERLDLSIERYAKIVHNSAIISDSANIGFGTVVMPGAIVNADVSIGNHAIINTNCVIEHDCVIEEYVHISPATTLTGNVKVGEGSHIGAGATVIPGIEIGSWVNIGAGSSVISNIESNVTAVGVPAKSIKKEGLI